MRPHDQPTALRDATRPIRLGVHGSSHLAATLVTGAGHDPDRFEFVPYEVTDPFRELRNGEADIMIVKYALREPDIAFSAPVAEDARAVIVGAHHPLAVRHSVSVEEAARYDAFDRPGDFPPYVWDLVVPRCTPAGTPVRRAHPMTTLEAMRSILATTDAVHLSFRSLESIVSAGIRVVPVNDLPPAPVAFAWLREPGPSSHIREFVAAAEARVRR
ncbi:LysR family transcriptional regulator substrate-binding protein [Streptomyces sp. TR1341]|uniref:LysR substrate-binding domain-containing protein n=1 Tax=Streptomyces sp. TR1341 TaxID=2601266 RepID=UPI00138ADC7A|nr:LysR family transcriptional regulator substrate-binding protein [Streptomyces sp. TR1341]